MGRLLSSIDELTKTLFRCILNRKFFAILILSGGSILSTSLVAKVLPLGQLRVHLCTRVPNRGNVMDLWLIHRLLFSSKPKAAVAFTDGVAIELLKSYLDDHCGEKVFLMQMKLWTKTGVWPGNMDVREIKIEARPVVLSEPGLAGFFDPETLPHVEVTMQFKSEETSVYLWQFRGLELNITNWGRRNVRVVRSNWEAPKLKELAEKLFAYRNGNELKRQGTADSTRPPKFLGAPTS